MAGRQQEGWRAAVALDPGDEKPRLGMRQLLGAMRAYRAAAMQVRIDQRAETGRAFEPGVERKAHLAQHGQVRPEARCDNDLVRLDVPRRPGLLAFDDKAAVG